MSAFSHRQGELFCEHVSVANLAERYGTPLYVYSRQRLLENFAEIRGAFRPASPLICYSVKANGNLSLLRLLAKAGSGFDIVSGGELYRAQKAGAKPARIVYAGVGKTAPEIAAALKAGIRMFNVESEAELCALSCAARRLGVKAQAALRLNPDVDARTHAKTTTARKENKFGIDLHAAHRLFAESDRFAPVALRGIHVHLGSPIYTVEPFRKAMEKVKTFASEARAAGAKITTLNVGGGYAVSYDGRPVIRPADYAKVILPAVRDLGVQLVLEPGRFIVADSAVLVSRVVYTKVGWLKRKFVILDAAMNDLVRPAMYGSYHHIEPVKVAPAVAGGKGRRQRLERVDVVGPVCESSDCFAARRLLPPLQEGDLVAIFTAGAYGMAMASNYNARPRACETLVDRRRVSVIRRRETYEDLIRGE